MHSSLEPAAGAHSSNNGIAAADGGAAAAGGAPPDGAGGPAYESLYNEPEDTTGARQTLIQVRACARGARVCMFVSVSLCVRVCVKS